MKKTLFAVLWIFLLINIVSGTPKVYITVGGRLQGSNQSIEIVDLFVMQTPDNIPPTLQIISPTGSYSYLSNVPLQYSAVDPNLNYCKYFIMRGDNVEKINTTISDCSNTTFSVSAYASYTLFLYAYDLDGNVNSDSSSFSIVKPEEEEDEDYPSGGGDGGVSEGAYVKKMNLTALSNWFVGRTVWLELMFWDENTNLVNPSVVKLGFNVSEGFFKLNLTKFSVGRYRAFFSVDHDVIPGWYNLSVNASKSGKFLNKSFLINVSDPFFVEEEVVVPKGNESVGETLKNFVGKISGDDGGINRNLLIGGIIFIIIILIIFGGVIIYLINTTPKLKKKREILEEKE